MTAPDERLHGPDVSDDAFLGGRFKLLQPITGYRAGLDAMLLAAATPVPAGRGTRVLDAGAGVGAVGIAVAARAGDATVMLIEAAPRLAELARANVHRNGLAHRVRVIEADLCAPARSLEKLGLAPQTFDHVVANPPFHEEGRGRPPADPAKAGAHAMAAGGLDRWLRFLARMAVDGGSVTLIHRAAALGEVLAALEGRFGSLRVLPIHPHAGAAAHRVLVQGMKGSRAPLSLRPGLILHDENNRFLPNIEAILRNGAPLDIAGEG